MTAPAQLRGLQTWTDAQVEADGLPIKDIPFVSVGGGLASFAVVDRLRIAGVSPDEIRVISPTVRPDDTFGALCNVSDLADEDPLRSESSARIDNLWGFPGYATEQAWQQKTLKPLMRVLGEPVFNEFCTPSVGQVREGVAREAERIGWYDMVLQGIALVVRRRAEGGYFVVTRMPDGRHGVYRCENVHIGLGNPQRGPGQWHDGRRVSHISEPHEHVYDELSTHGGTVIVRGTGIAASRVLERLVDERDVSGEEIKIYQLFTHYNVDGSGPALPFLPKRSNFGYTHQAFDYPRSAVGGQIWDELRDLDDDERAEEFRTMRAPSTPYRKHWAEQLDRGREGGWYQAVAGEVTHFARTREGVAAKVRLSNGETLTVNAGFVIDTTEADPDVRRHPLLTDLLATTHASVTPMGGLRVSEDFAVDGANSGDGRVFASGATATGGALAPVDTFAGMQRAAMSIADTLADDGFGSQLSPWRSVTGWAKWISGRQP